jgi:Holliday junction resolvase
MEVYSKFANLDSIDLKKFKVSRDDAPIASSIRSPRYQPSWLGVPFSNLKIGFWAIINFFKVWARRRKIARITQSIAPELLNPERRAVRRITIDGLPFGSLLDNARLYTALAKDHSLKHKFEDLTIEERISILQDLRAFSATKNGGIFNEFNNVLTEIRDLRASTTKSIESLKSWIPHASTVDYLSQIDQMSGTEFEDFIASYFTSHGFLVQAVGGANDNGVDIIAEKGSDKRLIQCKRYKENKVSVEVVQIMAGLHSSKQYGNKGYRAMIITSSSFTQSAKDRAKDQQPEIELWDRSSLVSKLQGFSEKMSNLNSLKLKELDDIKRQIDLPNYQHLQVNIGTYRIKVQSLMVSARGVVEKSERPVIRKRRHTKTSFNSYRKYGR